MRSIGICSAPTELSSALWIGSFAFLSCDFVDRPFINEKCDPRNYTKSAVAAALCRRTPKSLCRRNRGLYAFRRLDKAFPPQLDSQQRPEQFSMIPNPRLGPVHQAQEDSRVQ